MDDYSIWEEGAYQVIINNPCLETIIADFRSAIDELQKPN